MSSEAQQLTTALREAVASSSSSSSSSSTRSGSPSVKWSELRSLLLSHPRFVSPVSSKVIQYSYGTSGYRGVGTTLDSCTVRMALLAVLRALEVTLVHHQTNAWDPSHTQAVGLVVTASHNDAIDNGLKMIDATGEMLESEWEPLADRLVNTDETSVIEQLKRIAIERHVPWITGNDISNDEGDDRTFAWGVTPLVFVGRDTRSTSPHLVQLFIKCVHAFGGSVKDFGITTTPQLHWLVNAFNRRNISELSSWYENMSQSFLTAWQFSNQLLSPSSSTSASSSTSSVATPLTVDCANGVGAIALTKLIPLLSSVLPIQTRNTGDGVLNERCGAEHVQKQRALPLHFNATDDADRRMAALDGDADRLVYFYVKKEGGGAGGQLGLLDGDKLIALYATFIMDLFKRAGVSSSALSVGVVQTAYANGSSTHFLHTSLSSLPVVCTPTGVKYLHHAARQLDVAIYFEANGHGTVLFSDKAIRLFQQLASSSSSSLSSSSSSSLSSSSSSSVEVSTAAKTLLSIASLVNQCTGCALADMLLVELALHHLGWSVLEWDGVYVDLPSKMTKVKVPDRNQIITTDAERKVIQPAGLQHAIDAIINNNSDATTSGQSAIFRRAFVRPSGTEDVVRVYAEAKTEHEVDEIVAAVTVAVQKFCS